MDADPEIADKIRFLCLIAAEEKVAAAFYEAETGKIAVLSQMPEQAPAYDVSLQILRQVEPTITIISTSAPAHFVAAVRSYTDQDEVTSRTPKGISDLIDTERWMDSESLTGDADGDRTASRTDQTDMSRTSSTCYVTPGAGSNDASATTGQGKRRKKAKVQPLLHRVSNNVVSLATKFFAVENAKTEILNYDGFKVPANVSRAMKQSFLAGCIDFEESVTIRAVAGLITYLSRSAINQLSSLTNSLTVCSFRLIDSVRISDASLRSLAIVSAQLVPRHEYVSVKRQQAASISGLFEASCRTQLGKKRLRQMLVQPIRDVKELNDRLDFISFFIHPDRANLLSPESSKLRQQLSRVKSLNSVFRQMRCKLVPLSDWKTFVYSFDAVIIALESMIECRHPAAMAERAAQLMTDEVLSLADQAAQTVDLTASVSELEPLNSSFRIKEGVCQELDDRRNILSKMDNLLQEALMHEAEEWTSRRMSVPQFSIQFEYGPGFLMRLCIGTDDLVNVLSVLSNERRATRVNDVPVGNRSFLYFKTTHLKELDLEYGDAVQGIASLQTHIQHTFQVNVLKYADTIIEMIDHCASVEALLSFADMAKQEGWCRPSFSDADQLQVTEGKHPLYEQLVGAEKFQANGLISPARGRKVKIITGPNASGKTVFMKQVGIIVHLALCGSFVPATGAVIPVVDSIFTVLKKNYSITMESSTFFSDLKGIAQIVSQATSKSLVLVDEFGKGTRPQDGIALLAATIQYMIGKGAPHYLLASHFHCISDIVKENEQSIQYLRFKPEVDSSGFFQPNYMIEEGKAGASLASSVYAMIGLDGDVADRAKQVYSVLLARKALQPVYNEEQKHTIAMVKEIIRIFQSTNMGSKQSIDDMFEQVSRLRLIT